MLRVFPVAADGSPHFADEFSRGKHNGVDIFAPEGTPIFAVDDGTVRYAEDTKGGHAFYLRGTDGTVYYGAHLSRYEGADRSVLAGEVLGYVGHTGNAAQTSPHLHFEIHPSGGVAVNPYPALSKLEPTPLDRAADKASTVLPPGEPDEVARSVADLPRIPAPLPVPPIPHMEPQQQRNGAGAFVLALFCGGLFLASRRAHA